MLVHTLLGHADYVPAPTGIRPSRFKASCQRSPMLRRGSSISSTYSSTATRSSGLKFKTVKMQSQAASCPPQKGQRSCKQKASCSCPSALPQSGQHRFAMLIRVSFRQPTLLLYRPPSGSGKHHTNLVPRRRDLSVRAPQRGRSRPRLNHANLTQTLDARTSRRGRDGRASGATCLRAWRKLSKNRCGSAGRRCRDCWRPFCFFLFRAPLRSRECNRFPPECQGFAETGA